MKYFYEEFWCFLVFILINISMLLVKVNMFFGVIEKLINNIV